MIDAGQRPRQLHRRRLRRRHREIQTAVDAGQIRAASRATTTASGLSAGDIAACMAWTGDVVQLQADNPSLGYMLPDEGHMLWSDNFADPEQGAAQEERRDPDQLLLRPGRRGRASPTTSTTSRPVIGAKEIADEERPRGGREPANLPRRRDAAKSHVFRASLQTKRPSTTSIPGADRRLTRWPTPRYRRDGGASGDLAPHRRDQGVRRFTAVDDIDLTIPQGSFFALLGPSGCGKTTTLRMVAGLEEPTAGRIQIGDQDITGPKPYKRPVNTVFQSYALFPHLDIFENVAFGLRRRGIKDVKKQVDDDARARRAQRAWPGASPPSSPAASSSASRSPARSSTSRRAAARRAARRARPQAAPPDADRAQAHPDRGRHHVRARHPRPGGGHDHGRHHRGHERRADRADGRPGRPVREPAHDLRRQLPRPVQPDRRRR